MTGSASLSARPGPQWVPLSSSQQRLWLFSRLSPESTAYHLGGILWLDGALDTEILQATMNTIMARHDMLRARFCEVDGRAWQTMDPPRERGLVVDDLSAQSDPVAAAYALANQHNGNPFDLEAGGLLRYRLAFLGEQEGLERHALLISLHHIAGDAWSLGVFMQEFFAIYIALRDGHDVPLPPLQAQYTAFATEQQEWLASEQAQQQLTYWKETLRHEGEPLALPSPGRKGAASHPACYRDVPLSAPQNQALKRLARELGVSRFTVLLAVLQYLLARVTGQDTIRVGVPSANRDAANGSLIGFFVNNLVVQGCPRPADSVSEWIAQVHQSLEGAKQNRDLPFEKVVDALCHSRSQTHHPLFQVAFNYRQQGAGMSLDMGSLTARVEDLPVTETPFDLVLDAWPDQAGGLGLRWVHGEGALDQGIADRLQSGFSHLLDQCLETPSRSLAELSIVTGADPQLLAAWGQGEGDWVPESVAALFSRQATQRGDAIALVHGGARLSFAELEARSNQLARYLVEQGVKADEVVGVSFERGVTMIEAFLAVMKAGGAFLPLDPGYPADRLRYMLEDSGATRMLTSSSLIEVLPRVDAVTPVAVDELLLDGYAYGPVRNQPHPDQLAYVIYTSGSTGKPKGVALTHGGLSMHVQTIGERYGMTPEDVELQFASISFDGAVERWAVPLAFGSRVVIRDQELWSAEKCCEVLEKENVTIACFPPSYVGPLLDWIEQEKPELHVRSWTLGGEAFTRETFERMQQVLKPQRILNGYGPTETVVTPMLWAAYPGGTLTSAYAPIGTAVGPRKLYVLDQDLNRVPVGVAGELYIGNEVGLARGYHDRPDLTAERFLPDPFGEPGERMYRTGDLVQFRDDGVMEYLGRVDQQVKIRGFRIELGEIESRLLSNQQIREAAVVAQPSPTGDRLVGYVVPRGPLSPDDILKDLAEALPDYMVPSQLLTLEQLPLTPAGKVDRKALPEPQWQGSSEGDAPETDNEKILAEIWQPLLGVETVSRDDHFFNLGGHSLLAVQMVNRLRHQHQLDLPLNRIFEQPVLKHCAALCQSVAAMPAIRPVPRSGDLPCSAAQRRLWFVQQLEPDNGAYHMPLGLEVRGELHRDALQQALNILVANHESLRTRFVDAGGAPRQRILDDAVIEIQWQDLSQENAPEAAAEKVQHQVLSQPFDLASDNLLRVLAIKLADQRYHLLLVQHHIIGDGVSMQLLLAELSELYRQAHQGDALTASPAKIQYADYAAWQQQWLDSDEARTQTRWWVEQLGDGGEPLALPTDFPRGDRADGARQPIRFTDEQLAGLKQRAGELGSTVSTLLLSVWQILLHRYSGQSQVRVGVPVAGRLQAETETLQGCFINTLVISADFDQPQSFAEQVAATQQFIGEAQGRQALPFEGLVDALGVDRNPDRHPLFQVVFNHQRLSQNFAPQWPEALVTPFDPGAAGAQFELALDILEDDQQLQGFVGYDTGLFKPETIARLREHFGVLLEALLHDPQQLQADIDLLTDEEIRAQQTFNATQKRWGDFTAVPKRLSLQAQKTPDAIALTMGEQQLSYAQLDRRVNQLANRLRRAGVKEEVRVAIGLPRSLELVIGILAITRAGGAYVPLDPSYPQDRLAYILDASAPALLLTHSSLLASWPEAVPMWCLDELDVSDQPATPPVVQWRPDQAIYVIYTSGSTGKPKGVLNTQAALENRLLWMQNEYPLDASDCVLQKTPFSFDVSVWEFFWPLMVGARLAVAPPEAHADPQWLQQVMADEGVTTLHFVPSMLKAFVAATGLQKLPQLKRLICSGEALDMALQKQIFAARDDVQLHNLYGPTEAAIDVSYWQCRDEDGHTVPIGAPISNIQLHVLDTDLNPVPRGVPGELYLAGVGLARGYYGRADLTADRFIPNPFGEPGARMYRTGDQVVQRSDGIIEYLGRLDHQVKIRGLRIELGEIEQQLKSLPDVDDAVVVAHHSEAGDQLVAYVVSESDNRDGWQQSLAAALPDYMVPALLMVLEQMPLSPNGKLDRKALPAPQWQAREYRAPQTDTEQQLASLWEELLGQARVGLDDNFFALGGHSLLATRVVAALRDRWGLDIPLRALFEADSLQALAALVDEHNGEARQQEDDDLAAMADLLDDLEDL